MRLFINISLTLMVALSVSGARAQQMADSVIGNSLLKKTLSAYEQDRFDSTIYYAGKALRIFTELKNWRGVVRSRAHLIDAVMEKEEFALGFAHLDTLSKEINLSKDNSLMGVYHALKGRALFFQNKLDSARDVLTESTKFRPPIPLTYFIAEAYNDLGYCWVKLGREDKMIEYGWPGYELYKALENDFGCARILANMAISYGILGMEKKGIEVSTIALGHKIRTGNIQSIALGCCNLTQEYVYVNLDSAKYYQKLCVEYANRSNMPRRQIDAFRASALVFYEMKLFDSAYSTSVRGTQLLEQTGYDKRLLASGYHSSAVYAWKAGKDSTTVLGLYDKALNSAMSFDNKSTVSAVYASRSNYYADIKQYQQAYTNYKQSIFYKDSAGFAQQQRNMDALEAKYETAKKEAAIEELKGKEELGKLLLVKQKAEIETSLLLSKENETKLKLLQEEDALQSLKINEQQRQLENEKLEAKNREQKLLIQKQELQLGEARLQSEKRQRNGILIGGGLFLLVAAIGFSWYRLRQRVQQEKMLEKVRNSIAKDLHDDIGASLSNLNILNELSLRNAENAGKVSEFLSRSADDIRRVSEGVSDIVWNINPRYDTLEQLFIRMKRYAADVFDSMNIVYTFQFPETSGKEMLDMNRRRDFYLLFKDAVNDLARVSGAQKVSLQLRLDQHLIGILIEDDRPRISQKESDLLVLQEKANRYKVGFELEKNVGLGTRMFLSIAV